MAHISRRGKAVGIALVAACAVGGGAAAAIASTGAPLLGSAIGTPTKGFGKVKPKEVFLGGDPTGLVKKLTWASWGDPVAVGTGKGFYAPPGEPTAAAVSVTVTLKASKLGTCKGHLAYKRIHFIFHYKGKSHSGSTYGICGSLTP